MENRKIRVGITHGDINGVGYEVILKTFSDPTMLELCTPVIYGSPKVAAYHRKAMEIPTNFSIVNTAEDAQDGRVNVVNCIEEELKVELSKPTPEAGKAALFLSGLTDSYFQGKVNFRESMCLSLKNLGDLWLWTVRSYSLIKMNLFMMRWLRMCQ